jgi:hypothetical protein
VSLADLIIEHGPYRDGDSLPIAVQVADAEEANALRDELIELRRLQAAGATWERFAVESGSHHPSGVGLWLICPHGRLTEIEGSPTLAELNRRAEEHTKGCR